MADQLHEESVAFEELEKQAESVARDIAGDFPGMDTGYNLYVQRIVVGKEKWPYGEAKLFGLIDMGDAYMEAFVWMGDEWERANADPHEVLEAIEAERRMR